MGIYCGVPALWSVGGLTPLFPAGGTGLTVDAYRVWGLSYAWERRLRRRGKLRPAAGTPKMLRIGTRERNSLS